MTTTTPPPTGWRLRNPQRPLREHPRLELHRLTIGLIVTTDRAPGVVGSGPYFDQGEFTFVVPSNLRDHVEPVLAALTEHGYTATAVSATGGTHVTVATENLPAGAYEDLPQDLRVLADKVLPAKPMPDNWSIVDLANERDALPGSQWMALGEHLIALAQSEPGRLDLHALIVRWSQALPREGAPSADVLRQMIESLREHCEAVGRPLPEQVATGKS